MELNMCGQRVYTLLLVFACMLLGACSDSSDSASEDTPTPIVEQDTERATGAAAPVIGEVLTVIGELPLDRGVTREHSISFGIDFEIDPPADFSNLKWIFVNRANSEYGWTLFDATKEPALSESCSIFDGSRLYCDHLSDPENNPHAVQLKDWKITVLDNENNLSEKTFAFRLPNGEKATDIEQVHSRYFVGDTTLSVAALESMQVVENNLEASINYINQDLQIAFTSTDQRVKNYQIFFYKWDSAAAVNNEDEYTFVGGLGAGSPVIIDTPIVANQRTSVSIPWDEILFIDGYSALDIDGIEIQLYDKFPATESENYKWTGHIGVSELKFGFDYYN